MGEKHIKVTGRRQSGMPDISATAASRRDANASSASPTPPTSSELGALGAEQTAALLELSGDPQLLLGATGRVLAVNAAATRALGASREQMLGATLSTCARGLSPEALRAALHADGEHPVKLQGRLGQELTGTLVALRGATGAAAIFCLRLFAAGRAPTGTLASVVRLTGELGHDLNNQLAAVLNYAFVVERRLAGSGKDLEHLNELRAAAWRAAGLTRWLQLGGRRRGVGAEPLGVSVMLAGLEPLLRHLGREVPIELRVVSPRVEIWAALPDVELIVVALVGAALDRVTTQGSLILSATTAPDGQGVRIACTWSASLAAHRAARGGKPHAHGSLRRALRRSHARLGHDAEGVWADFPATPSLG
jgi:PAS domain-containing protein